MALLKLEKVTKRFGGLLAVDGLDLEVQEGHITGLVGPNGAGKSTVFNLVSGVLRPSSGKVWFNGEDITGLPAHRVAARGLVRTFQAITVFPGFTTRDNVLLGCHLQSGTGSFGAFAGSPAYRRKYLDLRKKCLEIMAFLGLGGAADKLAADLCQRDQRALGIAIALAASPKLLMLDEPTGGMTVEEAMGLTECLHFLRNRGMTLLIVEHNMKVIMSCCDRIAVLNFGKKIADGGPREIGANPDVIEAYLGAPSQPAGHANS